ncbi:UPF0561 protein C2orf68 homolog [Petromyzon marinus]|uniref:UPF0561 protein C2orf68 homolog n=1 Tax=Petromyzon marinus TaxID=7757 RepID=UPI003F71D886
MEPKTSRLDMQHGFVHHIRRNQIARDDYDREIREARGGHRQRRTPAPTRPRRPDQRVYQPPRRSGGGEASEDPGDSEEEEEEELPGPASANGRAASPDRRQGAANRRAASPDRRPGAANRSDGSSDGHGRRDATNREPALAERGRDSANRRPEANRRRALAEHAAAQANRKAESSRHVASANGGPASGEHGRDSTNRKPAPTEHRATGAANQRPALSERRAASANGRFRLEFEDDWGSVTSLIVNPGDDPGELASLLAQRCRLDERTELALRARITSEMNREQRTQS